MQTNGVISSYFKLGRGTRQGSPLSPLLFCLALEPLAAAIRRDPHFPGVTVGGSVQKLMLYADDILLFATRPNTSLPALLKTINTFSRFSGYRVNWSKSEALPLTSYCPRSLFQAGSFQWPKKGIRYLGILFPRQINDIVRLNFDPLLEKISADVERWAPLFLSLWGKVNVLKMNCIPKVNYLLQSLPIAIPSKYFKQFDKICNTFLWNGKRPRLRLGKLQQPVDKGGLGLPRLLFYHYAYNFRQLVQWALPPERAPPWYVLEQSVYPLIPPLLYISAKLPAAERSHPIISHLQGVWKKVSRIFQINPYLGLSAGIWANPKLCIGRSPFVWKEWIDKGILTLGDLYEDGALKSFEGLVQQYNLANNQFWRYLQLRHLLIGTFGSPQTLPQGTDLVKKLVSILGLGHEASSYYSMFVSKVGNRITSALKVIWERDLGVAFEEEEWDIISGISKQVSRDIRTRLIQFKIFHRVYWTPSRLFRLGLKENPDCWKCHVGEGNLVHALWSCPKILDFWSNVHDYIIEITGTEYEFCPGLYVLGNPSRLSHIASPLADWIQTGIMIGRQIIMRGWKAPTGPTLQEWLIELGRVAAYEKVSFNLLEKGGKYISKWGKYLESHSL